MRFDQDMLMADIAADLSIRRSRATIALQHWYTSRGLMPPDGRTRRSHLSVKHRTPPVYQGIADDVGRLAGQGLGFYDIAQKLYRDRNTITQSWRFWCRKNGRNAIDGRARQKECRR